MLFIGAMDEAVDTVYNYRLRDLCCLADPEDLLAYKDTDSFSVIQEIVTNCTRNGLNLPSHLVGTQLSAGALLFSTFI